MKLAFIIPLAVSLYFSGFSQCAEPPGEFTLEHAKDYAQYNDISFKLMSCLVSHPNELSSKETEEATAFCLMWLGGTPDYKVEIDTKVALFLDDNPEYLYTYIFAMTLVQRDFSSMSVLEKEAEALFLVAQYEQKSGCKKKNKALKRIAKLYSNGQLIEELEKIKNEKR